jgi:outer membrane protein assembly factor BamE
MPAEGGAPVTSSAPRVVEVPGKPPKEEKKKKEEPEPASGEAGGGAETKGQTKEENAP